MVYQFQRCCCTDLRTGTIIIGVLGIIGGLYSLISPLVGSSTSTSQYGSQGGSTTGIISVILGVIMIILNIVLIMGAVKRNPKFILPWIIVTVICTVIYIINLLVASVLLLLSGDIGAGVGLLVTLIIYGLIEAYLILIVNSFYTNLKNGEQVATQTA